MHYEIVSHRQTRDREQAAGRTWTVGELIEYLKDLDQEAPIIVAGYDDNLFNSVDWETIEEVADDGTEEEWDE